MDTSKAIKDKILTAAEKRMRNFGYSKVTMDEIAGDLSMSKNTIYKQFVGKEEIAGALVRCLQEKINAELEAIEEKEKDPLKVFSGSVTLLRKELGPWFEHFFREIPGELPELWKEFLRFRNEKILNIRQLVDKGIKKGAFRKINSAVAVQAYLGSVKAVLSPVFLQKESITFDEAIGVVLDIWQNGISKKGAKL